MRTWDKQCTIGVGGPCSWVPSVCCIVRASFEGVADLRPVAGWVHFFRCLSLGATAGVNTQTGQEVALKVESTKAKHPQLLYEYKLLKHLQGGVGIAEAYCCETEGDYNVMVMELLGPSLEDVFNLCNRTFSLKTILLLADQFVSLRSLARFGHSPPGLSSSKYNWVHSPLSGSELTGPRTPYCSSGQISTCLHLCTAYVLASGDHVPSTTGKKKQRTHTQVHNTYIDTYTRL